MALPINKSFRPNNEVKMLGNDRILKLTQRDVTNPKKGPSPGLIGRDVFTGGNKLHCVYNTDSGLWYFKLDHGELPQGLKQHFTSFSAAFKHCKLYFEAKKIDVIEDYSAESTSS